MKSIEDRRRDTDIDKALEKAYRNLIDKNWSNVRKHLDKLDFMEKNEKSLCLIVLISTEESNIEVSIAGIDYEDEYKGSPDEWITIFIEVNNETTKGELKSIDVVEESAYWENDMFFDVLYGEWEGDEEEEDEDPDDNDEEEDDDDDDEYDEDDDEWEEYE